MTNIYIFSIIINKLNYYYKFSLVILFLIYKNLKIYLYFTFLLFNLAINLRIKSYKEFSLNIK